MANTFDQLANDTTFQTFFLDEAKEIINAIFNPRTRSHIKPSITCTHINVAKAGVLRYHGQNTEPHGLPPPPPDQVLSSMQIAAAANNYATSPQNPTNLSNSGVSMAGTMSGLGSVMNPINAVVHPMRSVSNLLGQTSSLQAHITDLSAHS